VLYILCLNDVTDGLQIAVLDTGFQTANWLSGRVNAPLACETSWLLYPAQALYFSLLFCEFRKTVMHK